MSEDRNLSERPVSGGGAGGEPGDSVQAVILQHLPSILLNLSVPAIRREERDEARLKMDVISGNLRRILGSGRVDDDAVPRVFQEVIFGGMRLVPVRDSGHGESFLGSTLLKRAGNCTGLTSVYLAAARELGIDMRAILIDDHVEVLLLGGERDYLIETVSKGMVLSWEQKLAATGRILTDREFLALVLNNRAAFVYAPAGKRRGCERDLRAALRLFPDYSGARDNLRKLMDSPG